MEEKSWGIELWDQGDNLLRHASEQIGSVETYLKLLSEVQRLQHDFGKRLRKLAASYLPKKKPGNDDLTFNTSFASVVQNLSSMGTIYESGAKEMNDQVIANFKTMHDDEKKEFENQRSNMMKLNSGLDQMRKQFDCCWQKYVTAYKDKQKAYGNWVRAESDMQLPRIEQQKMLDTYNRKVAAWDQAKGQYAEDLSKYNTAHRQHYNKGVTEFLEDMEITDLNRTERTKELLEKVNSINEHMFSDLIECNRLTKEAVATIDSTKDGMSVIKRYRSTETPPVDLPFLDLDRCPAKLYDGAAQPLGAFLLGLDGTQQCAQLAGFSAPSTTTSLGGGSITGGMLVGRKRNKEELANLRTPFICDMSIRGVKEADLTVVQVADRLKDVRDQLKRTEGEIQGTQRLLEAYRNNPKLGSSSLVQPKEVVLRQRYNSLSDEIKRLEDRYNSLGGDRAFSEANSRLTKMQLESNEQTKNPSKPSGSQAPGTRTSEEFDSDNSFDSEPDEAPPSYQTVNRPSVALPGLDHSLPPPPPQNQYVGRAVVKYEYEGSGATYLAAKPGDVFYVVQLDTDNSGWTSVVSEDGSRKGFVPTGFIDITSY
ncbi:unnamed protein product [Calicophoron daubneyi]|uniref:Formin-binding protein 1-like n=1 Tax=Calicophoron daubneyi TaxID=300641 RepID=A0AAV2T9B5_CALDB